MEFFVLLIVGRIDTPFLLAVHVDVDARLLLESTYIAVLDQIAVAIFQVHAAAIVEFTLVFVQNESPLALAVQLDTHGQEQRLLVGPSTLRCATNVFIFFLEKEKIVFICEIFAF